MVQEPTEENIEKVAVFPTGADDSGVEPPIEMAKMGKIVSRLFLAALIFFAGLGGGYLVWGRSPGSPVVIQSSGGTSNPVIDTTTLAKEVNPANGFSLPVKYGDIGPKVISAGAFDLNQFLLIFQQSGEPLSAKEVAILTKGSQEPVVITSQNAHFLLNFFWALGLVNQNPILDQGPIQQYSKGKIDQFASTGGWTLGKKPIKELISSAKILSLTAEQQARVEEVAKAVYRPCCDNPTDFPDCNHGMAMLGLLELMASQGASVNELFTAAKEVNAFWFPQQALEQAIYFKVAQNLDYSAVDARTVVSAKYSSASGFRQTHQWLANKGLLEDAPNSGNGCGV
jgi:hypothetical protein